MTISIFVTTYGVANTRAADCGKWFDLADYGDKDDFMEAANEYAINDLGDTDPELLFSDYDTDLPYHDYKSLITADSVSQELWELLEFDEKELEILNAWLENYNGGKISLSEANTNAQNTYVGKFDNDIAFTRNYYEDNGKMAQIDRLDDEGCHIAINWKQAAKELMFDYYEVNHLYFHNV